MIKDLSFGIRLQKPIFCPQSIATLMDKCFHTSPDQRPDFEEIKATLVAAYTMLFNKKKHKDIKTVRLGDSTNNKPMYSRYSTMIKMNKEQKERDSIARKESHYLYMKKISPTITEEAKIQDVGNEPEYNDLNVTKEDEKSSFCNKASLASSRDNSFLNNEMSNETKSTIFGFS